MSRSFSINLKDHYLYRTMGKDQKPLKQHVDRGDLVGILNNLGYCNINEQGLSRARYGSLGSLEDIIAGATIGVPSTALVTLSPIGRNSRQLMVTFTY